MPRISIGQSHCFFLRVGLYMVRARRLRGRAGAMLPNCISCTMYVHYNCELTIPGFISILLQQFTRICTHTLGFSQQVPFMCRGKYMGTTISGIPSSQLHHQMYIAHHAPLLSHLTANTLLCRLL